MTLQFDPAPYLRAFQVGQQNEWDNTQSKFKAYNDSLGTIDKMAQIPQQNRDERMKKLVQYMQMQKANPGMNMENVNNYVQNGQFPQVPDNSPQPQPMGIPQSDFSTQQPVPGMPTPEGSPASLIDRHTQHLRTKQGGMSDLIQTPNPNLNIKFGSPEYLNAPKEVRDQIDAYAGKQDEFSLHDTMREENKAKAERDRKYDPNAISAGLEQRIANQSRSAEQQMRAQYLSQSKDFADTATSYQRIMDSSKNPSAAGDLSMIYNYMKMLDPGSTVREGEFATAQNAGSLPQSLVGQYNKIISGERLAPELRKDFVSRAGSLYQGQNQRHQQRVSEFKRLAQDSGLNPNNVVINLSTPNGGFDSPSTGKIRVKNIQTGQTGTISEQYFDQNKYEKVQ